MSKLAVLLLAACAALSCSSPASAVGPRSMKIAVLSNRADLISGGDALVEIVAPTGTRASQVHAAVGGRDVTSAFAVRPDRRFYGLVTGLADGRNTLIAHGPHGIGARIVITNHPLSGPVFAGAQVQPWVCDNEANGLGKATDAGCDTAAVFAYQYKDAASGQFMSYDPKSPPAAGSIATTRTDTGRTVPYIVRTEKGVIDRGLYQIAVLTDPKVAWAPWAPQRGWDHKAEVIMGSGCETAHKMAPAKDVMDDAALSRGYAVITTEMDDNTQDCNDVVQAEALMMLEEHLKETYGTLRFAIGSGCSGGSMAQYSIAANYPGLLNGIQPTCSFPDIWTTYREMADCRLLAHYFDSTSPGLWTEPQRADASGNAALGTCEFQDKARSDSYISAKGNALSTSCGGNPWTYDPVSNLRGTRCDIQDYEVAIFGTRAHDGFAKRPWDNTGVQYGLRSLQSGEILPEQFVDLNEKIGGLNIDGGFQADRTQADTDAVAIAYRTGRLNAGRELAKVPIMDLRGSSNYEEHFDFHTYEMRARLDRDNHTHANQVFWNSTCTLTPCPPVAEKSFDLVDRWVSAIKADHSLKPLRRKVLDDRPDDAVDACFAPEQEITDQSACRTALPYYSDPRFVAGGPQSGDVIKCQLKPLNRGDYTRFGVTFTDDQWSRLLHAFPTGVCDFSKPGVAEQRPIGPWITFAAGPGGRRLGPSPRSAVLRRAGRSPRRSRRR